MSIKKMITPLILAGFMSSLVAGIGTASPAGLSAQQQAAPVQAPSKIAIPKEVKKAMEDGLAARQSLKTDIPFTISESLYMPLPGQPVSFIYLLMKVKNADMGYAVPPAPQVIDPTAPAAASKLVARMYTFVQYYQIVDGKPGMLIKETYAPANFQAEPAGFDPEAIDWYSFGYPLPAGNYLAAVALATPDLTKVGIQYCEFTLPDPKSFTNKLDTASILFLKDLQQVQTPETQAALHRNELALSIYRLLPNLEKTFAVGNSLDLFFFVYGAVPNSSGKYDLQVEFEVTKDDKPAIKFAPGKFNSPVIEQPLPLKQTLEITTGDKKETKVQDLPAGNYVLIIRIQDTVSGLKVEKKADFIVK